MKLNEVIAKYGNQEVDESKIKEVLGVKESKIWKPNERELAWILTGNSQIVCIGSWKVDNYSPYYNSGNCFKTKEEAEFARDKRIFLTKFERYLRENEDNPVDYKKYTQHKHFLEFDYLMREIKIQTTIWCRSQGTIYTTNRLALEQFIKDNESDIKKYMFGVE